MSRLEELRLQWEEMRAAEEEKRDEQLASDMDAVTPLIAEHGGINRVRMVKIRAWEPGIAALAVVRSPKKAEIRRFQSRAKDEKYDRIAALEELAAVCVIYPEKDARDGLYTACPALPVQLGQEAAALAIGEAQEEGKG